MRLGIPFDPSALKPGMRIGGFIVDSSHAERVMDSSWVGAVRFRGTLRLTGLTIRHPDSDIGAVCFEADSASAARLPRWEGDQRRAWLCFSNTAAARKILGARAVDHPVAVTLDRFTIYRGLSDEVNSARLLAAPARCYRSPNSVLFGPATKTGQQGRAPGWIMLSGFADDARGSGELRDADGKGLNASWRVIPGDSVAVAGFDDFLRVEMRARLHQHSVAGAAMAHSDAALELDSTGKKGELRRAWKFSADERSCTEMPL